MSIFFDLIKLKNESGFAIPQNAYTLSSGIAGLKVLSNTKIEKNRILFFRRPH